MSIDITDDPEGKLRLHYMIILLCIFVFSNVLMSEHNTQIEQIFYNYIIKTKKTDFFII